MDLRHPYLTEQLIAYIGNKRALLPFLHASFGRLSEGRRGVSFSDPFAGSGAVSRLARLMGFTVLANDWERYSFIINSCYLGVSALELPSLFRSQGGLDAVLACLDSLPAPPEEERYISRHFAPARTEGADWRRDRLFYTAENALVIDAVRERIERMYPGSPHDPRSFQEKMVLLGPLLYEASTHTNTSGVFKAYHRGFGGHGRDALKRIMTRIRVRPPLLVDSPAASRVFCQDAESFVSSHGVDICYLDPPYASHQYGSNYFMLTTIALWDKPRVSAERSADGRLREKAGIRKDWVRTRSEFCSRRTAADAFRRIVSAADCRYLCVSYSDEGLVGPEELADILAESGALTVESTGYVKYPGGRQSIGRTGRNVELLFVVDRRARSNPSVRKSVEGLMLQAKLGKLLRSSFHPGRVAAAFPAARDAIVFTGAAGHAVTHPMPHLYRFDDPQGVLAGLSSEDGAALIASLSPCRITDREEEIRVLLSLIEEGVDGKFEERFLLEILRLLRGFAHRKYGEPFARTLSDVKAFSRTRPVTEVFLKGLAAVEETAMKRFGFAPLQ
jgi:adenine-specific DNA-methyltransferase